MTTCSIPFYIHRPRYLQQLMGESSFIQGQGQSTQHTDEQQHEPDSNSISVAHTLTTKTIWLSLLCAIQAAFLL